MEYEYTDTFGGEANYCWVKRGKLKTDDLKKALRMARREIGLTGVKGDVTADFGDEIHWKPRGLNTILMIRWEY
jgi:hypothetical protein